MFYKKIIIIAFSVFLFSSSAIASTFETNAKNWVENKGLELLSIFSNDDIQQRYEKIDSFIENHFDVKQIARFVLGRYFRQLDDKLKPRYYEVFEKYSMEVYKTLPLDFSPDISFEILGTKRENADKQNEITVEARIDNIGGNQDLCENCAQGEPINMEFRIKKQENKFLVFDVKMEGKSLLLSYRKQFSDMIQERYEDLYWFVDDLEKQAKQMEQSRKELSPKQKSY
jgi:phospholipid transport system substrate-binding protein